MPAAVEQVNIDLSNDVNSIDNDRQQQQKQQTDQQKNPVSRFKPADGGVHAWLICFTAFCTNGSILCIVMNFGFISDYLISETGVSKTVAGSIGSASLGMMFLLSFVASILMDRIGIRKCGLIGAVFCSCSLMISSFCSHIPQLLLFTHSFLFGFGSAMLYPTSLVILGHYFDKRLGLANGIVTVGSGIFSVVLSLLLKPVLLNNLGLSNTFRVLFGMAALLFVYAASWKEQRPKAEKKEEEEEEANETSGDCRRFVSKFMNLDIFKNRRFMFWCIGCPIAFFGVPMPFMFLPSLVKSIAVQGLSVTPNATDNFTNVFDNGTAASTTESALAAALAQAEVDASMLVTCMNSANAVARVSSGKLSDIFRRDCVRLHQIACALAGISMLLLPLCQSLTPLIILSITIGFGAGGCISLLGPITFRLVGHEAATQALGFLFQLIAIPITSGSLIAGLINDATGRWDIPFFTCGSVILLGGVIMFSVRRIEEDKNITVELTS